jgi:hypothetical protein
MPKKPDQRAARDVCRALAAFALLTAATTHAAAPVAPQTAQVAASSQHGLADALMTWRADGATSVGILLPGVSESWNARRQSVLGRSDQQALRSAWSRIFEDGVWVVVPVSATTATAALWSPLYDTQLITTWSKSERGWNPTSIKAWLGTGIKEERRGSPPAWLDRPPHGIVRALASSRPPSAATIRSIAGVDSAPEASTIIARVAALQSGLDAAPSGSQQPEQLLERVAAIWKGDAPALAAYGLSATDASNLAIAPVQMRVPLQVAATFQAASQNGVTVLRAQAVPGLYYILSEHAGRKDLKIFPVQVDLSESSHVH